MKEIKIQEALKQVKNKLPWRKILIHGEETYLIEQFLKKISSIRNVEAYYVDENLNSLYQFSGTALFGSSPIPVILNAQALPSKLRKKEEKERFINFIKNLEEFVIVSREPIDYKKLKSDLFQAIIELCDKVVVSPQFNEKGAFNLIDRKFKLSNKPLPPSLIKLIIETIGTDLQELKQETDKLLSYPGELNEKTVKELLFSSGRVNVFEIIVPLIKREKRSFLKEVERAISQGVEPLMILGLLQSQVRNLILIKLGEKPKLPQKALKTFNELSKEIELKKLLLLLKSLHEKEFEIKSGTFPPDLALKSLEVR